MACIWLGAEAWTGLVAVAAVGLGMEWASLCGLAPLRMPGLAVPCAIVVSAAAAVFSHEILGLLLAILGGAIVWRVARRRAVAAGVLYIAIPLTALAWLRGDGWIGRDDVVFLVLVVWASDVGAYVVGRMFGGPKLAPSVSPGKTWSGAAGGLVIAMVVGEAAAQAMVPGPLGRAAATACVLGVVCVLGDLLESWIKRRFGVKDSGRLIPGHGGLLDRLDGLLAAAPAAALLAWSLGREGVLWS